MTKIETKLKQQGWQIDIFQPKGEPYPWAMKISKKVNTKGLHSDSVTDWVRQCRGYYVITAYLNPTGKLSEKEKEDRITSSIRWELTKQYDKLPKYDYLNKLTDIVGEVHPLVFKKRVRKAYVENSNEKAFEEEKDIKFKKTVTQLKLTDSKQEPVKKKDNEKANIKQTKNTGKKSVEKTISKKKSAEKSLNTKNDVPKTAKKVTSSTTKKASSPKKKTSDKNKQTKQAKTTTKKVVQKATKSTRKATKLTTSTKKKISSKSNKKK